MNSVALDHHEEVVHQKKVGKEFTQAQRQIIVARRLWSLKSRDGNVCLSRKIAVPVMEEFRVSHWTLKRISIRDLENFNNPMLSRKKQ